MKASRTRIGTVFVYDRDLPQDTPNLEKLATLSSRNNYVLCLRSRADPRTGCVGDLSMQQYDSMGDHLA